MRLLFLAIAVSGSSNPCEELCRIDGPAICTDGSAGTPDGTCRSYFVQPSGEVCYHNARTSDICPESLSPLTIWNAALIVGLTAGESRAPEDAAPPEGHPVVTSSRSHAEIWETAAVNIDYEEFGHLPSALEMARIRYMMARLCPLQSIVMTTEIPESGDPTKKPPPRFANRFDIPGRAVVSPRPVDPDTTEDVLSVPDEISRILCASAGRDPESMWASLGGDRILAVALADGKACAEGFERQNACFALMLLASRLSPEFVASHAGLSRFIRANLDGLGQMLLQSDARAIAADRTDADVKVSALYTHRWIKMFPEIFQRPGGEGLTVDQSARLKAAVVRDRIKQFSMFNSLIGTSIEAIDPDISRSNAFAESVRFLLTYPARIRRGVSQVRFRGEEARGPGVRRDWFTAVASQLFSGTLGYFERTEDAPYYTRFASNLTVDEYDAQLFRHFRAIGRFMALSVIEGIPIGVYFPAMFYKRLIGQEIDLEDIRHDEPVYYRSLNIIKGMSDEELELLCVPLEHSGATDDVNATNRDAQIHVALQNIAINNNVVAFEALRDGFITALPAGVFDDVDPREIASFIYGDPNISVDDLAMHIRFDGYSKSSDQIGYLFAVLREYSQDQLKKFLRFVTGNNQLPLGGFGSLRPLLKVQVMARTGKSRNVLLPGAHTCFNLLDLPLYENIAELREKLTTAINLDSSLGFL